MKHLLTLISLTASLTAFGQDTASSPVSRRPAPERRHDVSFFSAFGGPISVSPDRGPSPGLMLRWASQRNPQRWKRVGFGYGAATRTNGERVIPVSTDTALLVRSFTTERMFYGLAGVEMERHVHKRTFVSVGIDVQAGYAWGSRDSSVLVMLPTTANTGAAEHGYVVQGNDVSSVFGTGLVFAGIRTYDKRYTIGLDVFTGVYAAYRAEPDFSLFDMNTGGLGLRFSMGYRF